MSQENTIENFPSSTELQGNIGNMDTVSGSFTNIGGTSEVGGGSRTKGKEDANVRKEDGKERRGCVELDPKGSFPLENKPDRCVVDIPNPDFYDFDRDKSEECFAVDQMWAIYDDIDGMPRFYARIKKVYSPGFKVQITWLDPDPDDQNEIDWTTKKLPVACGKLGHMMTETTEDLGMFSHRACWEKGPTQDSYKIYPRKGETWALFKNWDIKWSSDPENRRKYEYEFVEVLSDYTKESGINVTYLVKIKGFVSLFKPTKNNGMASFHIPPIELFRFSHRVPSFRTTGREREDVREGYFELDPASLPGDIEEISEPLSIMKENVEIIHAKFNGSSKSPAEESLHTPKKRKNPDEKNTMDGGNSRTGNMSPRLPDGSYRKKRTEESAGYPVDNTYTGSDGVNAKPDSVAHQSSSSPPFLNHDEIPEAEFYNFEDDKSHEKFRPGQIWALYCELDGLPKYYAQIKRVELSSNFRVEAKWLEACTPPKGVIQWLDKKMPICCGTFKSGEKSEFDDANSFSHLLTGVKAGRKNKYEIYPRKGEVWALYRNFNSEWSCSDLHKCEYDMVEVVEDNGVTIKVLVLSQVQGFETVFKGKRKAGREFFMEIPPDELLRFSHQVPAFPLNLGGCWELDPKAMPVCLFCSETHDVSTFGIGSAFTCQADAKEISSDSVNAKPDSVADQSSSSPQFLNHDEIPEAEFYNFEDDKSHEKFRPGQIWALFCELDGLPKFYAQIKRVEMSPNFRVEAKWLEACAPPKGVILWLDKKMPICCGTFTSGEKSEFDDANSFSHLLTGVKAGRKNEYEIYPRKGEVWALYRDFNSEWSCSDLHKCEYDMVEVMEDNGVMIKVLVLSQVQGFETVFKGKRKAGREFFMEIPPDELLRFSHQVPAFPLNLGGCWELDPKAMPVCLFSSETHDVSSSGIGSACTYPADAKEMGSDGVNAIPDSGTDQILSSPSHLDPCEIREAAFYNFENDKTREQFQPGQIWAMYCDLDDMPKYYVQIRRLEFFPDFKLYVTWLNACAPPKELIRWFDKKIPICCGMFSSGKSGFFKDTTFFSHQSRGVPAGKKNKYEIYPRKGEVWALYRNFNPGWSCYDLHKCDYDMVEVLEDHVHWIVVLVLRQVAGFETVFKAKRKAGRKFIIGVARFELLRFSHQVPAFRLTDEREGSVRGCWELDRKSIPRCLFSG